MLIDYRLNPNLSIRQYSRRWECSINTVQKIKSDTLSDTLISLISNLLQTMSDTEIDTLLKSDTVGDTLKSFNNRRLQRSGDTASDTVYIYNNNIYNNSNLMPLQIAIKNNLPNVSKMEKQLTAKECERLIDEYDKNDIWEYLNKMENYKPLRRKNVSVNQTLRNWLNRDKISKKNRVVV